LSRALGENLSTITPVKTQNSVPSTKNTGGNDVIFLLFCYDMNFLFYPGQGKHGKHTKMIQTQPGGILLAAEARTGSFS
jgi:hypothetical protein